MERDKFYSEHILEAISKIKLYTKNMTIQEFSSSLLTQDAVIRELEIIGEAPKHLSDEYKNSKPSIPWREVASMRDRLVHEYFNVDVGLVWSTIDKDLARLKLIIKGS